MSTKPNPLNTKIPTNAQLIFDAALADLNEEPRVTTSGAPVLHRARPLRACTDSMRARRERALNEAADALAKLWKR